MKNALLVYTNTPTEQAPTTRLRRDIPCRFAEVSSVGAEYGWSAQPDECREWAGSPVELLSGYSGEEYFDALREGFQCLGSLAGRAIR